ncbi:hypothetical protein TNCV_3338181 [Trichonephila clavipes]|nr:hypothetical protein TNCV_3338181 [Trichonephila clavipes]
MKNPLSSTSKSYQDMGLRTVLQSRCKKKQNSTKRILVEYRRLSQPPGQPIGVNDHFTKHPTREQPLSSQSCQKTSKISLPDEAR